MNPIRPAMVPVRVAIESRAGRTLGEQIARFATGTSTSHPARAIATETADIIEILPIKEPLPNILERIILKIDKGKNHLFNQARTILDQARQEAQQGLGATLSEFKQGLPLKKPLVDKYGSGMAVPVKSELGDAGTTL